MAILQFQNGPVVAATSEPIPLDIEQVGPRGPKGWTPVITGMSDGGRHLLFIDWTGGVNPKPTAGYLGENSLVADPAQALSLTGKGLTDISQEPNADLKFTYSDGSTQTIPAYFAPMIAAAAQVDTDAQAVEISRQQIVGIQANVQTLHDEVDNDSQAVETSRQQIVGIQADVTSRQATIQALHDEVDADAQAVEISRGIVQGHADNFEAQKDYFNTQLSEIDADVFAIEASRQNIVGMQSDVTNKRDETQTLRDQAQTARNEALSYKWFPVVTEAGTARILALTDAGMEIRCTNVSPVSITVPPFSSVAWADNTEIILVQAGAGQVTVVPGAGVTINSSETLKTAKQYSYIGLKRVAQNVWDLTGERQAL